MNGEAFRRGLFAFANVAWLPLLLFGVPPISFLWLVLFGYMVFVVNGVFSICGVLCFYFVEHYTDEDSVNDQDSNCAENSHLELVSVSLRENLICR